MENKVRIDGFLQDFALRVIGDNGSVGCGSMCFGGGKTKEGKQLKRSYISFEIWNPKQELCDALINGAGQEKKPVIRLNGRLREDSWPDKVTGKTIRKLKVVAEDIVINPEGAFKPKATNTTAKSTTKSAAKQTVRTMPVRMQPSPPPPPPENDPVDVSPPVEEDLPF